MYLRFKVILWECDDEPEKLWVWELFEPVEPVFPYLGLGSKSFECLAIT